MKIPFWKRFGLAFHVLRGRPLMFAMNVKLHGAMEFDGSQKHVYIYGCTITHADEMDDKLRGIIDDIPSPYRLEL